MIEKVLSPVSREIWKMLDHYDDWQLSRGKNSDGIPYTIIHEKTEISLWVCNGRFFLTGHIDSVFEYDDNGMVGKKLYTTKALHIGFFDRHILWFKVSKVLRYLKEKEEYKTNSLLNDLKNFNSQRGE